MTTNLHPLSPAAVAARRALFAGFTMEAVGSGDVIVPEVWGDMAQAEFEDQFRLLNSGAVFYDNTLEGNPGDTVDFGQWNELSDLVELTEDDVLVPEKFGTNSHNATIKEAGKAVAFKDRARLVGLGDPQTEALRQFGLLTNRKLDRDLIAAAFADYGTNGGAPLQHVSEAGQTMGWDLIAEAAEKYGDNFDPSSFAGLFIPSTQRTQLWKDEQFTNASKYGRDSVVVTGQIGDIAGIPVVVHDAIGDGRFALIKRNSLGCLYKRRPLVETDRDILARETVVTTNLHYGVKRMKQKGVLAGTLTPAAAAA